MAKKIRGDKPVYFIATKYKNSPADVTFYTNTGKKVAENKVEKVSTKSGIRLYTLAT